MPDRWTDWWRARVPEPARSRAFDPSLADLERDWAAAGLPGWRRRLAVVWLASQCRRLVAADEMQGLAARLLERTRVLMQDFRLALRRLARQRAFTATAVLTLALGIGANLAAAAYVYGFLLAPVNAPSPEELVRVVRTAANGSTSQVVSWPTFEDTRDALSGVDLAAYTTDTAQVGPIEAQEMRVIELVSGNYFRVLRQAPAAGRLINDVDDAVELARPVAVLSHEYWRRQYAGDARVVGQTLRINGAAFEIIGVAAPGFRGTYQTADVDLWVPTAMQQYARPRDLSRDRRGWGWLRLIGRREPGVSLEQAAERLDAVAAEYNQRDPVSDPGQALMFAVSDANALADGVRGQLTPVLGATMAFTALLFLVTCANLAGVMQSRLAGRRRELAIRQSLGAGRRRLLTEWAIECLLLALGGGVAGLLAARAVVGSLARLQLPPELVGNLSLATTLDWRLGYYALGLSAVAALLFGVLPAWRTVRRTGADALRDDSGTVAGGRSTVRLRRVAVVAQLALSGILLLGAALLGRSLLNQQGFDPGFETRHLGLVSIDLARQRVPGPDRGRLMFEALDRIRRDPGVVAVDAAMSVPLGFGSDARGFQIPGYTPPDDRPFVVIDYNVVGADYFKALGLPFLRGGPWVSRPMPDGPTEVVINETMARRFWEGRDPVGQSIEALPGLMLRITGVVPDVTYYAIGEDPMPYVYLPAEAGGSPALVLHVRTADEPDAVLSRLSSALTAVDPRLSPDGVRTFEEMRRVPLFPARFIATSALLFGALALVLAAVGLYGVVTLSVGQRTREIGVRMALGARPAVVVRGVLAEALVLVVVGLALAVVGGGLVGGALRTWLYEVSPFDPIALLVVAVLLMLLAFLAAWLPARRAARINPVLALRQG